MKITRIQKTTSRYKFRKIEHMARKHIEINTSRQRGRNRQEDGTEPYYPELGRERREKLGDAVLELLNSIDEGLDTDAVGGGGGEGDDPAPENPENSGPAE